MIGILFVKKQQGTNKVSKSANIKVQPMRPCLRILMHMRRQILHLFS